MAVWQIHFSTSLKYVLILENIKYVFWYLLIVSTHLGIFTFHHFIRHKKIQKYLIIGVGFSGLCWLLSFNLSDGGNYVFLLFLVLSLSSIVAIEKLYRNADTKIKWALWPMTIALGTSAVFDFVIFAQASMVNQLDFTFWYARGYLITMAMPMLLVSARRMKNWSVDVFVSREVVFYSSMLMISGLYLLLLAL